jgi:hypothetical protein
VILLNTRSSVRSASLPDLRAEAGGVEGLYERATVLFPMSQRDVTARKLHLDLGLLTHDLLGYTLFIP